MPWQWDGRGQKAVDVGGNRGTTTEAATSVTWPNYQAAYLATRLGGGEDARDMAYVDKYKAGLKVPAEAQAAYFDKVTANYKAEADECLKREFNDWLQGNHELNDPNTSYPNLPGQMQRKYVFRAPKGERNAPGGGYGTGNPTEKLSHWHPTWWGRGSLTFLPGVRDYLREQAIGAAEQEYMMNLLAEFGPANIDQAWMYFKHWVKGRPLTEATCLHDHRKDEDAGKRGPSTRAPLGPIQPDTFHEKRVYDYNKESDLFEPPNNMIQEIEEQVEPPSDAGTQTDPMPEPVQNFITNNFITNNPPPKPPPKVGQTPQANNRVWNLMSGVGSGAVGLGANIARGMWRSAPSSRQVYDNLPQISGPFANTAEPLVMAVPPQEAPDIVGGSPDPEEIKFVTVEQPAPDEPVTRENVYGAQYDALDQAERAVKTEETEQDIEDMYRDTPADDDGAGVFGQDASTSTGGRLSGTRSARPVLNPGLP